MLRFDVPHLDDALSQQHGQPTLLLNDPGVDAQPFLLQAAASASKEGRKVTYLSTDRSPGIVAAALKRVGGDPAYVHILDGHAAITGVAEPDVETLDVRHLDKVIQRLRDDQADLLVVDSLNGLATASGPGALAARSAQWQEVLASYGDAVTAYTSWSEADDLAVALDSYPNRVHLTGIHERVVTNQYFRVDRLSGAPTETPPVLYNDDDGKVRVYIPKILVTGDADAGKTTFVHTVCDHAVSAERSGKTVVMDRGHLETSGLRVDLFGTPGQPRFDPLLAPLLGHAVGIILVVDSTAPESFPRAMDMLRRSWKPGVHAIIAANKQDKDGALDVDAIRERLRPPQGMDVLPCTANDPRSARNILDHLIYSILNPEARP